MLKKQWPVFICAVKLAQNSPWSHTTKQVSQQLGSILQNAYP